MKTGLTAYKTGDCKTAFREFKKLAKAGNPNAQFSLAVMYFNRQGVARDDIEVVKWVTLAATRKFAPAQFRMGQMYEQGVLFTRDPESAMHWYRQAETNGSKTAAAARARLARSLSGPAAATAAPIAATVTVSALADEESE